MTTIPFGGEAVDGRPASERWRAIPIAWRAVLLVVACLVALELGLSLVSGIAGSAPAGEQASSSFATSPGGVAAMAQLLAEHGHPVVRDTRPLSDQGSLPGDTLFIVDPTSWTSGDTGAVARFLASGGQVVVAGQPPGDGLLSALFSSGLGPTWSSTPVDGPARSVASGPLTAGIESVTSGTAGSFAHSGSGVPVLAAQKRAFAITTGGADDHDGTAVLVASSTAFTNAALGDRDNAAFALNLAGSAGGTVVFDEYDHGYGRSGSGLAGLPPWWRWGLVVALGAVVVWMLSAGRRFGPVEATERPLIPARVEYVDAVAIALATMPVDRLGVTVAPVRAEARRLLCRRAAVAVDAPDDVVAGAAHAAGLPDEVIAGVVDSPRTPDGAVASGRALAWLEAR